VLTTPEATLQSLNVIVRGRRCWRRERIKASRCSHLAGARETAASTSCASRRTPGWGSFAATHAKVSIANS